MHYADIWYDTYVYRRDKRVDVCAAMRCTHSQTQIHVAVKVSIGWAFCLLSVV